MRILLVEDEKDLANIIKQGLEEEGYAVDVAYDGEEGLYMAENFPGDVIILDIMLPVIDGLTILSSIRRKGLATPVILLTARDALLDKIKGLDTGAVVTVKDTGIGIPGEKIDRIFDRFYRVDSSRELTVGSGLGLSIVRTIVEAHGGSIEVESAPDKGSTFRVRLPGEPFFTKDNG